MVGEMVGLLMCSMFHLMELQIFWKSQDYILCLVLLQIWYLGLIFKGENDLLVIVNNMTIFADDGRDGGGDGRYE